MTKRRVREPDEDPIEVEVVRDGRLRTRVHWEWSGNRVRIRVPRHAPKREVERLRAEIVDEVRRKRAKVRARADADLQVMAQEINREHFGSEITWHSIRWVSNMRKRLGSCTTGGPTDGDIRISDRIKGWPQWVIEYVVAHELVHRKHPNHSKEYWAYLARYPEAERARGFIMGIAFQLGEDADDLL
jgi:predicted metal-dependent hydrolase